MKKLLFGIALILYSIFVVVLDMGNMLPGFTEYIYVVLPIVGLVFCVIGLVEKDK